MAKDVTHGLTPAALLGKTFTLKRAGIMLKINDAHRTTNIVATYVQASNGVIHDMDKVLLPKRQACVAHL